MSQHSTDVWDDVSHSSSDSDETTQIHRTHFRGAYSSQWTLLPERTSKALFSATFIPSVILLVTITKFIWITNIYHMFAYLLILLMIWWNITFYSIIYSSDHLHMIYIKRQQVPHSPLLFIPYGFFEDPQHVVTSVSAVNAIVGSNAERSSLLVMYATFAVSYCAVTTKWAEHRSPDITALDIQLTLFLFSAIGLLMTATWQMEHRSPDITALDIQLTLFLFSAIGLLMTATWQME
eukprot:641557_1